MNTVFILIVTAHVAMATAPSFSYVNPYRGCQAPLLSPLPTSSFNATSTYGGDSNIQPYNSKMLQSGAYTSTACWTPSTNVPAPGTYILADLLDSYTITGVVIAGRQNVNQFVRTFSLQYLDAGGIWQSYKPYGTTEVFDANVDTYTAKQIDLPVPIENVRYVRLLPLTCQWWCSMRWELLGCK